MVIWKKEAPARDVAGASKRGSDQLLQVTGSSLLLGAFSAANFRRLFSAS
jgi:hypothetical protein